MIKNAALHKSLALLAHPFSLSMLALLLINDHLLRRWWPSWWSGKLGDFAWLGFFPFALAALLGGLLPLKEPRRQRWVKWLAFGLTGGVFALAKTAPLFHRLIVQGFEYLSGLPSTLVRDPSDLLALPALGAAWWLWDRTPQPALDAHRPSRRAAFGLILWPLAALLTLANSAMPDYGITCLLAEDGVITAQAAYATFSSSDGGITWHGADLISYSECHTPVGDPSDWREVQSSTSGLRFRYRPGEPIQSSGDGGQTWQVAYAPPHATEAMQAYIIKTSTGNPSYLPGPLQAVEDLITGSLIFAMGHDGVLVRTAAGEWRAVPVGPYRPHRSTPDLDVLRVLLSDQLILAFLAALLIYVILAVPRLRLSKRWMVILLWLLVLVAALAWLVVVLLFPPALSGYGYALVALGLLSAGVLLVILALAVSIDLFRSPIQRRGLLALFLTGLGGGLLFFLPALLWAFNILPTQGWSVSFSLLFLVATLAAAFWKLPRPLRGSS